MTPLEFITAHPKLSFAACIVNMIGSYRLTDYTMPVIVMQSFQVMAWGVTIIVGSITIVTTVNKWLKKYFKKHPEKK